METKTNIVTKQSEGYNYSYASLSDIVKQGYPIPKTKTGTEEGKDYLFYYDPEIKEWLRGAAIVIPESKGMNAAQLYGSALTYALRYTTILANRIAADDDKNLETKPKDKQVEKQLQNLADEFRSLYPAEEQERILNGLMVSKAEDIGVDDLEKYINYFKYGKKKQEK